MVVDWLLRVNIPRFDIITKRQKNMTKPRTKERQDVIAAGGPIFLKAGGQTFNGNDYFIAKERTQRIETRGTSKWSFRADCWIVLKASSIAYSRLRLGYS